MTLTGREISGQGHFLAQHIEKSGVFADLRSQKEKWWRQLEYPYIMKSGGRIVEKE